MTELQKLEEEAKEANKIAIVAKRKFEDAKYDAEQAAMEPIKNLVIRAHDILCRWNHTDGCGWGYEVENYGQRKHNWEAFAHRRWLEHYHKLINGDKYSNNKPVSIQTINKLLDFVEEIRKIDDSAVWILRNRLEPN